jgi:hypothetical protein
MALVGRANRAHATEAIHLSGEFSTAELPLYVTIIIMRVQRRWKSRKQAQARRTPNGGGGGGDSRGPSPAPKNGLRLLVVGDT